MGEESMRCTNCGNEINSKDMKFCDNCGTTLSNMVEINKNKQVNFLSGKEKILFNLFFEEYCETRIKSKESHEKIQKKAKILGISGYDLEQYLLEFLDRVEKINGYISSGYEDSENGLNEEEVYLFAADYGFDDEQASALIQERSYAQARKWIVEQEKKRKASVVTFEPIEVLVSNKKLVVPGLCLPIKILGEASFEIANNYKEFEQKIKITRDLSYKNVKKIAMHYFDLPLTQFYCGLEKYGLLRECDKIGVECFKENVYRFEPLLEDEEYVKYRRKEVLEELFGFIRRMLEDEIIGLWWSKDYVGFVNCIANYEKSLSVVDEIKKCKKTTEEKIEDIINFIREGTYYSEAYIYLTELWGFSESEEIEFLEGIQKYIIEGYSECVKIKEHLNKKYKLTERRSVADVILSGSQNNKYSDGTMIEYGSDVEAIEARKQREDIIDIHAKLDYSSNKTFYPSLKRMECIYENTGIGASLIDDAKRLCEQRKHVSDLIFVKRKGLINDNKKIPYKTLDEANEAEQYKKRIIEFYNECSFTSDAEVKETISKIGDVYKKSGIGNKVLEHCELRYQEARSIKEIVVDAQGQIVAYEAPVVYNTIQEKNSAKEELDRIIQLFKESVQNNHVNVEQVYECIQSIVEQIHIGQGVLDVLLPEVEKAREKLVVYDYTTKYTYGDKERSSLTTLKRVENLCKSEEEAKKIQKKVHLIADIYRHCDLTDWHSVKEAIEKIELIYAETQCGKEILDELKYRFQELDFYHIITTTSLYRVYEKAILEELIKNLEEKNFQSKEIITNINKLKGELAILRKHEATEHFKQGKILRASFEEIGESTGICLYGKPGFVETSVKIGEQKSLLSEDLNTYFPILVAGKWYPKNDFFEGMVITDEYIAVLGYLLVFDQKIYFNSLQKIKVKHNKVWLYCNDKTIKFKISEEIDIAPMLEVLAEHLKIKYQSHGVSRDYAKIVKSNAETEKSNYCQNPHIVTGDKKSNTINQNPKEVSQNNSVSKNVINSQKSMKKRKFITYLLLTFLTCGIYGFYFWYRYTEDVNRVCDGDGKKSPNYIVVVLLSCITLGIYSIYWRYVQTKRLYKAGLKYQVPIKERGVSVILLYLAGIYTYFLSIFVAQIIMIIIMNKFVDVDM